MLNKISAYMKAKRDAIFRVQNGRPIMVPEIPCVDQFQGAAKLTICIRTAEGSKTLVSSGHTPEYAYSVKRALERLNKQSMEDSAILVSVSDSGVVIPMRERLRVIKETRRRERIMAYLERRAVRKSVKPSKSNVTPIKSPRRSKGG